MEVVVRDNKMVVEAILVQDWFFLLVGCSVLSKCVRRNDLKISCSSRRVSRDCVFAEVVGDAQLAYIPQTDRPR